MVFETGGTIEAADYNQLATDVNKIFGTGVNDFGYGGDSTQVPALVNLLEVADGGNVDNQNWLDLRNAFEDCADHQGTTLPEVLPATTLLEVGDVITFFDTLDSIPNKHILEDNRLVHLQLFSTFPFGVLFRM